MPYDNTNSGALFKNQKKETDKHPDYQGMINADGVDYWLSAWIKEGKSGRYMSLSIKPKESKPRKQAPKNDSPEDFGDSIPF